jgi:hypothetical protein
LFNKGDVSPRRSSILYFLHQPPDKGDLQGMVRLFKGPGQEFLCLDRLPFEEIEFAKGGIQQIVLVQEGLLRQFVQQLEGLGLTAREVRRNGIVELDKGVGVHL